MAIKFEIYRQGKRQHQFEAINAVAMGPESVPISGDVEFTGGLLVVSRSDDHAAGVSLMWDMGDLGVYHCETTRLPHRAAPYILNVELARFRLMRILQKQEDWNLFDFPRADRFSQMFKEAQSLFADALGKLHEPAAASQLADQAMVMATELSEQMAVFHADLLINRRRTQGHFVKHIFGCRIDTTVQNERYRELASNGAFDYAVVPIPWNQMQPAEQQFDTSAVDGWMELLHRKRVPVIAGPLVRMTDNELPDWMFIWEQDYETFREMAYEYVQKIVTRYRKSVSMWNVAAGLGAGSSFTMSFEQVIELTRLLVSQVKNTIPNAKTLITITAPFGEYHADHAGSVPPMLYAEMVAQSGINFEGFGLELEMGVPTPGRFTRDLFQLGCLLDKFSTLGRPVFLTGVCVPGRNGPDGADQSGGQLDPSRAGRWRKPWDAQVQADWMAAVYKLALSRPYVESIAWSNLSDMHPSIPAGGLLDDILQPKPAMQRLQELRKQFVTSRK